jgi:hypothetical protein
MIQTSNPPEQLKKRDQLKANQQEQKKHWFPKNTEFKEIDMIEETELFKKAQASGIGTRWEENPSIRKDPSKFKWLHSLVNTNVCGSKFYLWLVVLFEFTNLQHSFDGPANWIHSWGQLWEWRYVGLIHDDQQDVLLCHH